MWLPVADRLQPLRSAPAISPRTDRETRDRRLLEFETKAQPSVAVYDQNEELE